MYFHSAGDSILTAQAAEFVEGVFIVWQHLEINLSRTPGLYADDCSAGGCDGREHIQGQGRWRECGEEVYPSSLRGVKIKDLTLLHEVND